MSEKLDALSRKLERTPAIRVGAGIVLAAAVVGCSSLAVAPKKVVAAEGDVYTPGTYTASAAGISSDVVVEVTVDGKSITEVYVDSSGETPGIGADAAESLQSQILEAQGPSIDGVAGATITSTAAREAVIAALKEAAGGMYIPGTYTASATGISSDVSVTLSVNGSSILTADVDSSGETPDIGGAAEYDLEAQILDAQSAEIEGVSGATITTNAVKEAVSAALAEAAGTPVAAEEVVEEVSEAEEAEVAPVSNSSDAGYVPGTYTASAAGISSDIAVTLTVDESSITDVTVDVSGETPGIGAAIGDKVIEQILAAQSAEIDGVAGATISSTAVKSAVADCIAQAAAPAEAAEAIEEVVVEEAAEAVEETVSGAFVPGTYTASAAGISSDITVTLTVDESSITDATVDVSGETPGIGAAIGDKVIEQILAAQSAEIDGVAGATISSTAVKSAVADCIAQAAAPAEAAEVEENEAVAEEAAPVATGYIPGTYVASSNGMGKVTVAITVNEKSITAIGINTSEETPAIGGAATAELRIQILAAQGSEIDGVAGASMTSNAVRTAVADCLAQAKG